MSVFSKKYWLDKGFTEDEAIYQIAIRRPNNVLYYINKGFTIEEAKEQVKIRQSKGGQKRAALSIEDRKKLTPRCIEFWMEKGLTKDEAMTQLSLHQATFSKQKCIQKYGTDDGIVIWQERQNKWQNTLMTKPDSEIEDINRRKNRWKNLSEEESIAEKVKIGESVRSTCADRTVEDKRELGRKLSEAFVKCGIATPIENRDAFKEYRNRVYLESSRYDLSSLENFDKRGARGHHLDHKYSVFEGFKNNVPVEVIGHICNLEMLPFDLNTSKGTKCSVSLEELMEQIKNYGN